MEGKGSALALFLFYPLMGIGKGRTLALHASDSLIYAAGKTAGDLSGHPPRGGAYSLYALLVSMYMPRSALQPT